ncbi:hypothetical protein [Streptomyces sp. CC219B]|uniref:hypothetical protein n=1 Tax=Streptomyces sp. CC219B TaxID=3044574 RepID=UPI0024A9D700|nr:hypothetical protein [Streptomyces sp. CC219B]
MNTALLSPAGWLVLALPWPAETRDGWGECAAVIAPSMIPRSLVSQEATTVLDLATALAGDTNEGPGKAVFFSDITLWLDQQGQTWTDLGIDHDAVIAELLNAPVPQLFLTLSQTAHAILCDASRQGLRLYYSDGGSEPVSPQQRRDVHDGIAQSLERDWPPYIQGLINDGVLRSGTR